MFRRLNDKQVPGLVTLCLLPAPEARGRELANMYGKTYIGSRRAVL